MKCAHLMLDCSVTVMNVVCSVTGERCRALVVDVGVFVKDKALVRCESVSETVEPKKWIQVSWLDEFDMVL